MIRKEIYFIAILIMFFQGCKPTLLVSKKTPIKNIEEKELFKKLKKNKSNFSNIRIEARAQYLTDKRRQRVKINLRMVKNKTIWASANMLVPLAKMLITPEEVAFYDKLNKTYYEGEIDFINDLLPVKFDFYNLQNCLIGKSIIPLTTEDYMRISHPSYYAFTTKEKDEELITTYFFDPMTFLLKEQRIFISESQYTMNIKYNNYQRFEGAFFPKNVEITVVSDNTIKILLNYTNISSPKKMTFPFSIPKGYKNIKN